MPMPWNDGRLNLIEAEAQNCTSGDACTADVIALVAEVRRLREVLATIARKGNVGPPDPPTHGRAPDPWYNGLVEVGRIADKALGD